MKTGTQSKNKVIFNYYYHYYYYYYLEGVYA